MKIVAFLFVGYGRATLVVALLLSLGWTTTRVARTA
jgi:hypothetical protein